jgi:hypothetical protein
MAASLFPPPVDQTAERPPRGPDRPAPPEDPRPPGRRPPGRRGLAAALVVTALLGGVAGGGVVALTADDPSPAPTVLQPAANTTGTPPRPR